MKKILTLVFILGAFFAIEAQDDKTVSPALQEARSLNVAIVKLVQRGMFEEALPIAQKVVQMTEKELGKDHIQTAKALTNLGDIYYSLNNKKEAEKSFEGAIKILDKQTAPNKDEILLSADVLDRLAFINYSFVRYESAENLFEKALLLYEKAGEKNSLQASRILFSLGNLKSIKRDFVKASKLFEQILAIRIKKFGERNSETIDAFSSSACALKKADKEKEIKRIQETYFPAAEITQNVNLKWAEDKIEKDSKITERGVINGKALSLPRPPYPAEARQVRASGAVNVLVKINERGDVVYACGAFSDVHKALIEASESAAYSAKFSPTLLKDKPVKVSGIIVYNFRAP